MWKSLCLSLLMVAGGVDDVPARDLDLSSIRRNERGGGSGRPAATALSGIQPVPPETTFFGGTVWAADSSRWEAIPGSCWTFDSGVGSSFDPSAPFADPSKYPALHTVLEGWTGWDRTAGAEGQYFRRLSESDFAGCAAVCVGDATGILDGDWSFHAGLTCGEADGLCYAGGQGYGSGWNVTIRKSFTYEGGDLTLSFEYLNETEDGYDFTHVVLDTTGLGDTLVVASFTGAVSGSAALDLVQGIQLPVSVPATVTLIFQVVSDDAYDDQDGLSPTACGAFSVDDVLLAASASGDTLFGPDTFETGDDGWSPSLAPGPGGDWSDIAALADLDPPLVPAPLEDSVLVFRDLTAAPLGHGLYQDNVAVSPWIDLKAAGLVGFAGKILEVGEYSDLPFGDYVFGQVYAQWYPAPCPATGRSVTGDFVLWGRYNRSDSPEGGRFTFDLSDVIDPQAEQIRVAIGVVNLCRFFPGCSGANNPSPYFDDIRFGVLRPSTITIQAAVDAAAEGDTVVVPPGLYYGEGNRDIDFGGKNLVLWAPAGPESTIIDCQGLGRGIILHSNEDTTTVIDGFMIRNGHTASAGGGIAIQTLMGPTVRNCVITGCTADYYGGGVYAEPQHYSAVFQACTITGDTAQSVGGGMWGSAVDLFDCTISGNRSIQGTGGGLFAGTYGADLHRCEIFGNEAGVDGGGAGGIHLRFDDCTVRDNVAGEYGGGISRLSEFLYAAKRRPPGGTEAPAETYPDTLFNCTITGNRAQLGGGGVASLGLQILNCLISGNAAGTDGGGAWLEGDSWIGLTNLRGCLVTGNQAARGGGIYAAPGNPQYLLHQEIFTSTVSGNRAEYGGGIYLDHTYAGNYPVYLGHAVVWGNCATMDGEEIYVNGPGVTLDLDCSLVDSTGIGGFGAVSESGPRLYADPLFCDPVDCALAPTTLGDYSLQAGSPCLPGRSPCDTLIGVAGEGCPAVGLPGDAGPTAATLLRVRPNPFDRELTLSYAIPDGETGEIRIFDVAGRLAWARADLTGQGAVAWRGTASDGRALAAGVYLVRIRAAGRSETRRVVFTPR